MDLVVVLTISAALGIIPGKIAERKGHSFWIWWFYGWMLFIFAIIHVQFIEDYNSPTRNLPIDLQQNVSIPDEISKYKRLLDDGIITEEEFKKKKKQLLG